MTTVAVTTPGGTVARLDSAGLADLYRAWLMSLGALNTRAAYHRDMADFGAWCAEHEFAPLAANRAHIDAYRLTLEARGLKAATVARRLSALRSFFQYAIDAGVVHTDPTARVRRPRVSDESPRLGLTRPEAVALLEAAEAAGPREHALVLLLLVNGLRVSEALALTVADLDTEAEHRVARVHGKGGRVRTAPLAPIVGAALDAALEGRTTGHVITGPEGTPLNRHQAAYIVRRLARQAGITKTISPHSLRHTAVTLSLESGAPLHRVQDMAGHASPTTTRRYDRARAQLTGHAAYGLAAYIYSAA